VQTQVFNLQICSSERFQKVNLHSVLCRLKALGHSHLVSPIWSFISKRSQIIGACLMWCSCSMNTLKRLPGHAPVWFAHHQVLSLCCPCSDNTAPDTAHPTSQSTAPSLTRHCPFSYSTAPHTAPYNSHSTASHTAQAPLTALPLVLHSTAPFSYSTASSLTALPPDTALLHSSLHCPSHSTTPSPTLH
jgi:hypothetical protein